MALQRCVVVVSLAAVGVLGAQLAWATPVDARTRAACSVPGSRTIKQIGQVRVFTKAGIRYACHRRVNRSFPLNRTRENISFQGAYDFSVAGPYVGYSLSYASRTDEYARVRVIDARSGRVRRSILQRLRGKVVMVRDLEVGRTGAVGWIVLEATGCGSRGCLTVACAVRSADGGRRFSAVLLDSGGCFEDGIQPESLSRQGTSLTWSKLGQTRSANLRE
jgi:hypothetical protein